MSAHSDDCTHAQLEDKPAVAATESGGPPISPGRLVPPVKYDYEVVEGFFHQTRGDKHEEVDEYLPVSGFGWE